jgi:hypothetical protein
MRIGRWYIAGIMLVCGLLGWLLQPSQAYGQYRESRVQVEHIAGSTFYFRALDDSIDEMTEGDSVYVYREEEYLGLLNVLAVSAPRFSAEFADAAFALTRGEELLIKWQPKASQSDHTQTPVTSKTPSVMDQQGRSPTGSTETKPQISGRWMTYVSATRSVTRWSSKLDKTDTRVYFYPSTSLHLNMRKLPGDWSLTMRGRLSYRYNVNKEISDRWVPNVYELQAEKSFQRLPLHLSLGRFYNDYDNLSGFWDGAMVRYGKRQAGIGVLAGYQPVRGNEGFSRDLPKASAFLYHDARAGDWRFNTSASVTTVQPSRLWPNHWYGGLKEYIRSDRIRFRGVVQADRNPTDGTYQLSLLQTTLHVDVTKQWRVSGYYNRREPYYIERGAQPFSYLRQRGGVNLNYHRSGIGGGVGVAINHVLDQTTQSITGRFYWNRSPWWNLGWSAHGSYYNGDSGHTMLAGLEAHKDSRLFGTDIGYQLYNTQQFGFSNTSHRIMLRLNSRFDSPWRFSLQLQEEIGELIQNQYVGVTLWRSF